MLAAAFGGADIDQPTGMQAEGFLRTKSGLLGHLCSGRSEVSNSSWANAYAEELTVEREGQRKNKKVGFRLV